MFLKKLVYNLTQFVFIKLIENQIMTVQKTSIKYKLKEILLYCKIRKVKNVNY
jgi:hypothetical protein